MDEEADHVLNPMDLTLDELISLNSLKNQKKPEVLEKNEPQPFNEFKKPINGYGKPISDMEENNENEDFKQSVQERLRSIPHFGSKPIHDRLGYHTPDLRLRLKTNDRRQKIAKMRQALKFANVQHQRLQMKASSIFNPSITVVNDLMLPVAAPLTRRSVSVFDRMSGAQTFRFGSSSSMSIRSANTAMRRQSIRHSFKYCLNEKCQAEIRKIPSPKHPSQRTRPEDVQDLNPTVNTTGILLGVRFASYE